MEVDSHKRLKNYPLSLYLILFIYFVAVVDYDNILLLFVVVWGAAGVVFFFFFFLFFFGGGVNSHGLY